MFRKVPGLIVLSLRTACASGEAPQILASTRTVDASHAYALPPPGGPTIVSVIERPYNNAVQQEISTRHFGSHARPECLASTVLRSGQNQSVRRRDAARPATWRYRYFPGIARNTSWYPDAALAQLCTEPLRSVRLRIRALPFGGYMHFRMAAYPAGGKPDTLADRQGLNPGSLASV